MYENRFNFSFLKKRQTLKNGKYKSSKINLQRYVRATFIIRKDLLKKLKDWAYVDRKQIKETVNEALEFFLKDKRTVIKKEEN
jgi:hypothetical protein